MTEIYFFLEWLYSIGMLKMRSFTNFILIIAMAAVLCGCSGQEAVPVSTIPVNPEQPVRELPVETVKESVSGMLGNPDVNFEVPIMYPSVMVNRVGYENDGDKQAIIIAASIPATFRVVDKETGEIAFEGSVKSTDYEMDGLFAAVADYSDLKAEGTYYIETEILGCSPDFMIGENVYGQLLAETFARLNSLRCDDVSPIPYENNPSLYEIKSGGWYTNDLKERDVVEGCLGIIDLIIAYEYHPQTFSDKMGIAESKNKIPDILDEARYEAEWLIKMQNSETGGVYNGISMRQVAGTTDKQLMIVGESSRATAYFCATMARFSHVYNKYDRAFANKCLKAATKAWNCLKSHKGIVTDAQMYRAAVEMYNVTGKDDYRDVVEAYLSKNASAPLESRGLVDAAISYMSSPESTDIKVCRKLMASFLDRTLEKTALARLNPFGVESSELPVGDLLRNADEMVIVDYINTSKQYENNEVAYLDYLCGRNETSTVYVKDFNNPDDCAKLLVLLGRLTD